MPIIAFIPLIIIAITAVLAISGLVIISVNLREIVEEGGVPIKSSVPIFAIALLLGVAIYGWKTLKSGI